jgi:hypothetical protein
MKIVDLTGQIFGKLTVIQKMESSRDGSKLWQCKCDCGNLYQATTRHLNRIHDNVRSCGCSQFKKGKEHSQWEGVGEISGHWWNAHVKHSANCPTRQTIELTLTKEEAWELFLKQDRLCALTGIELVFDNKSHKNTASLDRIDNTIGYKLGNVRWVHKTINMMKRTYSDTYFIEWCQRVVANINSGACPIK